MMSVKAIQVSCWGKLVGAIARDPGVGAYVFEYAPAWIKKGVELAPLQMPLEGRSSLYTFPGLNPESFKGLPGLIADALPDDFGNQLIDAWMASKGVQRDAITTLDRLAYMGQRGMGALEFKPARSPASHSSAPLEMKALVEAARRAVQGGIEDEVKAHNALTSLIRVGTSAGGARAKAVIAWNPKTHEVRSGQFDVDPGFEHWLLKFDGLGEDRELGTSQHYGRIEYAYFLMAQAAGITMSSCRLMEENGRAHFMTRRFDRAPGNVKHHVQTLCALQHMDYKLRHTHAYESVFLTAAELKLADDALQQLFLRMAFNVAAKNHDDHTKNFAFLLREGEPWELAPAYDVTHAYNPKGEWTKEHLMSVNGKFDDITRTDLLAVADRFNVPGAKALLDKVNDSVAVWGDHADAAGLATKESVQIAVQHQSV